MASATNLTEDVDTVLSASPTTITPCRFFASVLLHMSQGIMLATDCSTEEIREHS